MKAFRITLIFSFLFIIIFFNWNCSDQSPTTNTETNIQSGSNENRNNNGGQTDGHGSGVSLAIEEYVQLSTDGGNSFINTRIQIASFNTCACFPPANMANDSFTTPATGWRDLGNGQWVRSVSPPKYKIIYTAGWDCQSAGPNTVARWEVSGATGNMTGLYGTCSTDPAKHTGNYSSESSDITTWSNNQSHTVSYGTDVITGDDGD